MSSSRKTITVYVSKVRRFSNDFRYEIKGRGIISYKTIQLPKNGKLPRSWSKKSKVLKEEIAQALRNVIFSSIGNQAGYTKVDQFDFELVIKFNMETKATTGSGILRRAVDGGKPEINFEGQSKLKLTYYVPMTQKDLEFFPNSYF